MKGKERNLPRVYIYIYSILLLYGQIKSNYVELVRYFREDFFQKSKQKLNVWITPIIKSKFLIKYTRVKSIKCAVIINSTEHVVNKRNIYSIDLLYTYKYSLGKIPCLILAFSITFTVLSNNR